MPIGLPKRSGPRPQTTPSNPHLQLDQNTPPAMYELLVKRCFALRDVLEGRSLVSLPDTRAMFAGAKQIGPANAFMIGREFAHVHGPSDGSMHLAVVPETLEEILDCGWAEIHPVARRGLIPSNVVMLFGPRDAGELETIMTIVEASHARAMP